MKPLTRREVLGAMSAGAAALGLAGAATALGQSAPSRSRLGLVSDALGIHQRNQWVGRHQGLAPAVAFLEEGHRLGAGGIQYPFTATDTLPAREVRRRAEAYAMHIEVSLNPPRDAADAERFEHAVRVAQEAGANVARTVIMPGRRYEQFQSLAEFREFDARGLKSLQLAEPILARHKFRLAVENHKDHLVAEKLEVLKKISSKYVGLCVDVINNFALLEDPIETVRAFAPFAMTVHLKDESIRESEDGFWLSDEPLGAGFLDLPAIVRILRQAQPDVRFNLETITRDPIHVAVRTEKYWATFPGRPRSTMDLMLKLAREKGSAQQTLVSQLSKPQQLELERRNVERSLKYAREKLNL